MEYLNVSSGTGTIPTATIRINNKGRILQEAACGDGPVDAAYKAIDKITKTKNILEDYSLRSISRGMDALGEVTVRLSYNNNKVIGRGTSTDILEASAKAYLSAINRIVTSFVKGENKKVQEKL